ncbi:MAG: gamma-glutamyltransferase [Gammaproteobacteria bacterium]|nr:gamma-glutamyltransferase [Gammaproteobacteria bacterium]
MLMGNISVRFFFTITLASFLATAEVYADKPRVAIASAHPLATEAGFEVINKGGNAFDAAVAVSAALAVVEPAGSGLGGGGYWLLHRAKDHREIVIDGREKAPLAAHKKMFLDNSGKVIPRLSLDGALAAAIPGFPAGLAHLSEQYGKLPLTESLKPAIRLARFGFAISERHRRILSHRLELLTKHQHTANIFLDRNKTPKPFAILRQPDLAGTLTQLAESGRQGFYEGDVADKLINTVRKAGGIWQLQDLINYRVIERTPVKGNYHGITITSAPPSSSGGVVLLEALNVLTGFDLDKVAEVNRKHLIVEALRRAYHDRALYLGDPNFIHVPVSYLLSKAHADFLRSSISPHKAMPSSSLFGNAPELKQGRQTTHFSIIDEEGNRVAATLSINMPFGAGMVAEGTGVLLNDEMDDFVSSPDAINGYGLTGGSANAIAPGKRMLSSMTPTFVETADRIGVLGTPGGSRIISMVLLGVLDFAQGNSPDSWVKIPRYHHQYLPDVVEYETGALTAEEINQLNAIGHTLKPSRRAYGDMQAVQLNKTSRQLTAASDPRGEGSAKIGY